MGVLINGKYYKDASKAPTSHTAPIAHQVQSYDLEQAGKQHDLDLIQPYKEDGSRNPDFAKYYPELAKEYGMEDLL